MPAQAPAERSGALEWVLMGSIVLYAVQSVYAEDSAKALEQVVFFYVPFALLFALLRGLPWRQRTLLWAGGALVALALVFTAIGFWEFQTRHLLLNPKVIASNQVEEYFRVNSLFFDPNIFGRFLALVMIGLASVLIWAKRPRSLALTIAALVVLWGGLITTLSQSSFAALLLGLLVLAWLRFGGKVVVWPALGAIVIGAVLVFGFGSALKLDISDADSLNSATSGRFDLMEGGSTSRARSRCWAGARARSTPSTARTSAARGARPRPRRTRSRSRSRPSRASSGSRPTWRCSRSPSCGCCAAPAGHRCGPRSPPASSPWCCTRGSTPRSSRTR